jgi:AcrR family transcriptional regulator
MDQPTAGDRHDRSPGSIWSRPDRGTRGPAPGLNRVDLVTAAVALADAEGLTAVQMRAVAAALGTGAGSLYRYLSSRDDLFDLMTDQVLAELQPYPVGTGDWLDDLLALARRQLALYHRHPWLVDIVARRPAPGPQSLVYLDNCLGIMAPLDCGNAAKFEAIAMMTGVVSLFARLDDSSAPQALVGVDAQAHPHLTAALTAPPAPASSTDLFERTLRSLLTGLLQDRR